MIRRRTTSPLVLRVCSFGRRPWWRLGDCTHHPADGGAGKEAVHEHQHTVRPPNYLDYASALYSPQSYPHDLFRAETWELPEKALVLRKNPNLSFRGAWTQSHDSDPGASDFLG